MKRIRRRTARLLTGLAIVLLNIAGNIAHADSATLSWTNATKNTDGTTIPATGPGSLTQSRVEWGNCSAPGVFGTVAGQVIVPAPGATTTITSLPAGTTACFRVFNTNTYGVDSGPSAVVSKSFPAPTPMPPVMSTTVAGVYEAKGTKLRLVGLAPLGTPCGDYVLTRPDGGRYYELDRNAVQLIVKPRAGAKIVSRCEIG